MSLSLSLSPFHDFLVPDTRRLVRAHLGVVDRFRLMSTCRLLWDEDKTLAPTLFRTRPFFCTKWWTLRDPFFCALVRHGLDALILQQCVCWRWTSRENSSLKLEMLSPRESVQIDWKDGRLHTKLLVSYARDKHTCFPAIFDSPNACAVFLTGQPRPCIYCPPHADAYYHEVAQWARDRQKEQMEQRTKDRLNRIWRTVRGEQEQRALDNNTY